MAAAELINEKINAHEVMVFAKSYCPFCKKAVEILKQTFGSAVEVLNIEDRSDMDEIQDELLKLTGARSVPRIFIKSEFVGGCDDVVALSNDGKLKSLL